MKALRLLVGVGRWIGLTLLITTATIIAGFIVVACLLIEATIVGGLGLATVMGNGSMHISAMQALMVFGVLCVVVYVVGCVVHDRLAA